MKRIFGRIMRVLGPACGLLLLLASWAQSAQQTFTLHEPETIFTVDYDCKTLKANFSGYVQKPPQLKDLQVNIRRVTRECTPEGGKAEDEWCTQEVWRVTVDYSFKSDASDQVFSNKGVYVGEIACECNCVKLTCPPNQKLKMSLFWITNKGPHTEWWNVWAVDSKSQYHDTHFTLSWACEGNRYKVEWDATVFVPGGTGFLAITGIREITGTLGEHTTREDLIRWAQSQSGFQFAEPPSAVPQ